MGRSSISEGVWVPWCVAAAVVLQPSALRGGEGNASRPAGRLAGQLAGLAFRIFFSIFFL